MSDSPAAKFDHKSLPQPRSTSELDLDQIRVAARGIRYGEIRVIIQDGVVVQIERMEKQRLR